MSIQRSLRAYNRLELAVTGKPWTLGIRAADEIDRLGAYIDQLELELQAIHCTLTVYEKALKHAGLPLNQSGNSHE